MTGLRFIVCFMTLIAACNSLQKKAHKGTPAPVTDDSKTIEVNGTSKVSAYTGTIDDTPNDVPQTGDYYSINVVPIITKKCGSCHGAVNPGGGLNLTERKVLKNSFADVANMISLGLMPKTVTGQANPNEVTEAENAILSHWYNVEEQ